MPGPHRYIGLQPDGTRAEFAGLAQSAGVADADRPVATGAEGYVDETLALPIALQVVRQGKRVVVPEHGVLLVAPGGLRVDGQLVVDGRLFEL